MPRSLDNHPPSSPRALRFTIIGILVLFMGSRTLGWDPLRTLEHRLYRRVLVPLLPEPPSSERIAILAVDDSSLERLGERWPLSSTTWVRAISRLAAYEPEAIVLDLAFDPTASDEVANFADEIRIKFAASRFASSDGARALMEIIEDARLQREGEALTGAAIKAADRVILGVAFSEVSTIKSLEKPEALSLGELPETPRVFLSRMGVVPMPPSIFDSARAHGSMNLVIAPDGFVHRYAYALEHDGAIFPSLALATALFVSDEVRSSPRDADVRLVQKILDVDEAAPHLRFHSMLSARNSTFLRVPVADLFSNAAQSNVSAALRGRVVFVGATASSVNDFVLSPHGELVPSVEVHATALENLWNDTWLETGGASPWLALALTLLFLMSFSVAVERMPRFPRLTLLAILILIAYLFIVLYFAHAHALLLDVLPLPFGLALIAFGGFYSRWRWTGQEQVRLSALGRVLEAERLALERFRGVVEHVGDAIVSVDDRQVVRWMNPAAESLFSRHASTAIDRPVGELVARLDPPRSLGQILEAQARVGGELIPLEATVSTMHVGDERFTNYVFRDVAARKALERQKDEFIASINHELRTPITSMLGSLRLIAGGAMGEMPARVKDLLQIAEKNGERLLTLVSDLLDAARIDAGRFSLERKPMKVQALLEEAGMRFESLSDSQGVTLSVIPPEPTLQDVAVDIDRERIIQVFGNFISNAIKHSPRGASVSLHAERRPPHRVRFTVTDSGPGLSPEHQDSVFERFTMTVARDGKRRSGAGLGLSIAKAIVDAHGGLIGFDSEPGHGAAFWFELQVLH